MPVHDWARVDAGIFHHFHHSWIEEIQRTLNAGLLPEDYYALAEQHAAGFGPDVLTLKGVNGGTGKDSEGPQPNRGNSQLAAPQLQPTAETDAEFYDRKKSTVAIRHVSGDDLVAVVEIVSPGNKSSRNRFAAFLQKVSQLLEERIHLLIIDVLPPSRRDPQGIHAAVWDALADEPFTPPSDKPLTVVAYECDLTTRAYVRTVAVGDVLPDMPLFLQPGGQVPVPLEATYQAAWLALPRRWRNVL